MASEIRMDDQMDLENPASPVGWHHLTSRWRLRREEAESEVRVWTHAAAREGVSESITPIRRGSVEGAFGTQRFAEAVLRQPHMTRVQLTWRRDAAWAYLVFRGVIDHEEVAGAVLDGLLAGSVDFHNIAGMELAMTVERPPDSVLAAMRRTSLPIRPQAGPIEEQAVIRTTLRCGRRRIPATVRCYTRRGDPSRALKLEVSTSQYGDDDVERSLLSTESTVTLRSLTVAANGVLRAICRKHQLQPMAMPLNYKVLPVRLERRNAPNLIRDKSPAGPRSPDPGGSRGRSSRGQSARVAWAQGPRLTSLEVSEAGIPVYLDDDDLILLARLAQWLPIQQERYERSRARRLGPRKP